MDGELLECLALKEVSDFTARLSARNTTIPRSIAVMPIWNIGPRIVGEYIRGYLDIRREYWPRPSRAVYEAERNRRTRTSEDLVYVG